MTRSLYSYRVDSFGPMQITDHHGRQSTIDDRVTLNAVRENGERMEQVLIGEFAHESNTFAVERTTRDHFRNGREYFGDG